MFEEECASATYCLLFDENNLRQLHLFVYFIFSIDKIKMPRMKKNSTKKQRLRKTGTVKKKSSNKSNRSSDIVTNNFEIFVTDFLTDPCGLPVELRDCVLVDGATSINITAG